MLGPNLFLALIVLLGVLITPAGAEETWAAERTGMIDVIEHYARTAPEVVENGRIDARVLDAMRMVPRHQFVPEDVRALAYADRPLPIGFGQTISQPFIVALMTHLLRPSPGDRMLEVGTGSGYQAAVLSPLVARVHTIEIVPELGERAAKVLQRFGYDNVEARVGDGYYGWPEAAPFDGIVVTAAASHVPPPLVRQLKPGGRMVIPIGGPFAAQQLMLVEKRPDGELSMRQLLPVRFVPFTGAAGR